MPVVTHVVQIQGLERAIARLHGLKGRQLEQRVLATLTAALRSEVVPAMRAAAPASPNGMRGRNRHASGTLKRSMGVDRIRKRAGEMLAVKVGPRTSRRGSASARAWYAHFVVRGTKPHLISAPGLSSSDVRRLNRGGALALAFNGIVRGRVDHPGARANPAYVYAGRSRVQAVKKKLVAELLRKPGRA